DLADAGTRYAGWGSLKEGVGLDGATMYGDVVRDTVVGGLDFVTGTPTIRENTNDQLVMDGTEVAGDIAIIVGSLGTAGLAKAGIRTGANIVRHTADDVAEVVIPRTADEFAAAAVAQTTDDAAAIVTARTAAATTTVNTTVDLAATAASLGQLVRPLADIAERTAMGIKNLFIRSATGILDDAASVAARNADAVAPSLLSQPVTRGGLAAMTAAPIVIGTGIAATEVATGGAVSEAVMDGTIASMRALIASGAINAQNLETSIDAIGFITELGNAMDKSAQNGAVNAVLHAGDPQSPETIALAKNTAIGWLLRPDNAASIIAAHGIRSQLVDDIIPDQNAADRYLAEAFIDNIVSRSHVNALGDNQITREDVRQHIESIFANPNNPLGSALRGGRLENGLRQIWPDFQAEPATAPVVPTEAFNQNAQPQEQNVIAATGMRWKGHLDSLATNLGQIQGLAWLSPIIGLIAAVVGMVAEMFQSNSTVAQTDNPERLAALGRTLGQPPGTVARVDHDGTPQDPITTGPERHLPLQPGLTPALQ
ncbi:MAG: hypothetical protein KJ667_07535, partial [Alphaproteobacteria bacterium]|nr:hypothetical protein [Alphaproteobacteria bacterium]